MILNCLVDGISSLLRNIIIGITNNYISCDKGK